MKQDDGTKVDELVRQLKDTDINVRMRAAIAIGNMGTKVKKQAIPALLAVLLNTSENFNVHSHAVMAIQKMGLDARPALIECIKSGTTFVRRVSARGLGDLGAEAVPALIKALDDPDRNVRMIAVQSLGRIGPPAKAAVSALQVAAKHKDYSIANSAIRSLWLIQPSSKAAAPFPHGAVDRGLTAFLQCSKTEFEVGEPISLNHGILFEGSGSSDQMLKVFRPFLAVDPGNRSWFEVTGPDGKRLRYQGIYVSFGAVKLDSAVSLYRGESLGTIQTDLALFFNLARPGAYRIRWGYAMHGTGVWSGKLMSNSVQFKIVERRPH